MPEDRNRILGNIRTIEARLQEINNERERLNSNLKKLRLTLSEVEIFSIQTPKIIAKINASSVLNEKIALFRSLFRGREDVYPKLWSSKKTGNKGYSPVCGNEWINGVCEKPGVKCGECDNRKFSPLNDEVIRSIWREILQSGSIQCFQMRLVISLLSISTNKPGRMM